MKKVLFSNRASFARTLVIAFAACLFVTPASWAQEAAVSAPALASTPVQAPSELTNNVILGKNTKGPYFLSWKLIEPESETVTIDGLLARRGVDYNINYESGTMSFDKRLRVESIVQVQYRCQVGKSVPNTVGLSLPIEMSLLQRDSSSLRFTGLYKEADNRKPNSGVSVFGLMGSRNWGAGTHLSSQFLTSSGQDTPGTNGIWDRSAFKLGASRTGGRLQVKTGYERSGESFAGSKEYGLTGGNAIIDLSAVYSASNRLSFASAYNKVEDIAGADKGAAKTTSEQKISYAASSSSLGLTHKTSEASAASGTPRTQDMNKLEATHVFGSASAAASVTTSTVKDATTDNISKETTSALQVQAGGKVQVQGSHTESASAVGDADSTKVAVVATPTSSVKLSADYQQAASDVAGDLQSTGVRLEASPDKRVKLQANYLNKDSTLLGPETFSGVRVEASPTDKISLAAGLSEKLSSDVGDVTREARLQFQPGDWLRLRGGILTRDAGGEVSTVTDVNALLKPVEFLSLFGGYKSREMADPTASVDTVALDLSLNSSKYLKLSGSYQRNPEDEKTGQPLALDSTTVGAETKIGSLSLSGGYSRKSDYAVGSQMCERRLGLGLPVFGHGTLTTGIKRADAYLGYLSRTTTYSLGYTHRIGSSFNLMLSGSMMTSEAEQSAAINKPEYEAEAKLGVKF
ncbi:MAG: hypothetical protein Q7T82_07850 [Armatimonadota bacterium]|nr:hypothetical protein [Armatimonadota bacterium]